MRRMLRVLLALVTGLVLITGIAPIAHSATLGTSLADELQAESEAILEQVPGGVIEAPGIISWDGGAVRLTLEGAVTPQAFQTCETGAYCAWQGANYSGRRLSFTNCWYDGASSSLAPITTGLSAANARGSGIVSLRSNGSTVGTLGPNSGTAYISGGIDTLVCYS